MKTKLLTLAAIVFLFFSGCSKDNSGSHNVVPPDPSGTITSNLGVGNALNFTTINGQLTAFCSVQTRSINSLGLTGCDTSTTFGTAGIALTNSLNFNPDVYDEYESGNFGQGASGSIANVGAIGGLGAITTHPASGYSSATSVTAGTGYVLQITDYDPKTFQRNHVQYYRIYVQSFQLSTSGGVLGVTLKYQGPF